jgi:2-oxoglutarate ferredoxin oxidoreductase subunit delta
MYKIYINKASCKGCGICIEFCPKRVFEKASEVTDKNVNPAAIVHPEKCVGCLLCELYCPDFAVSVETKKNTKKEK